MRRRSFLKGAGIVTVAVVGGSVWRAWDQGVFSVGEGPAYEPWKDWRKTGSDAPLALVRAAILAASPHNTQPWLFKVTNSSIDLDIDTQRSAGGGGERPGGMVMAVNSTSDYGTTETLRLTALCLI